MIFEKPTAFVYTRGQPIEKHGIAALGRKCAQRSILLPDGPAFDPATGYSAQNALDQLEKNGHLTPAQQQRISVRLNQGTSSGAGNSKTQWDGWQNYEKVTEGEQAYAKVGERLYSKYAVDRMQPGENRFDPSVCRGYD